MTHWRPCSRQKVWSSEGRRYRVTRLILRPATPTFSSSWCASARWGTDVLNASFCQATTAAARGAEPRSAAIGPHRRPAAPSPARSSASSAGVRIVTRAWTMSSCSGGKVALGGVAPRRRIATARSDRARRRTRPPSSDPRRLPHRWPAGCGLGGRPEQPRTPPAAVQHIGHEALRDVQSRRPDRPRRDGSCACTELPASAATPAARSPTGATWWRPGRCSSAPASRPWDAAGRGAGTRGPAHRRQQPGGEPRLRGGDGQQGGHLGEGVAVAAGDGFGVVAGRRGGQDLCRVWISIQ